MMKRKFAGFVAGILAVSAIPQFTAGMVSADDSNSYDMNVTVNLDGEKKEISPYIYGINDYGNTGNYRNVKVKASRQGGNRYTGYNWETNYSNAGHDWLHSSDTNIGDDKDGAGYAVRRFSETCETYNIPYKLTTLQMAGYVSADKDGTVTEEETAPSKRWNKVEFKKDGELSLEPDLTDDKVYMDEYVNYLVKTLGDASTSTGIQAYSLDNEPVLWNDSHPRLHPEEVTNSELVEKSIELAKVVKSIDSKAEVFGPAFWGMLPCIQIGESGDGFTDPDWQKVKDKYNWYLDYYLEQMADAEKECGTRLLDVIDVHYYAQDCSSDEAILQAARSLYDPDYVENSWLQPFMGKYFPFIPNIQKSIDKYYPGTKIAVSEYNLANISDEKNTGKSVVSAIAEAEALGCFADNNVYFATYWGTLPECPYVESAINLYTNYDGNGADFGDTLVETKTDDISLATAYASIGGDDDSNVTMVLSNKDMTKSENAEITLSGSSSDYKSVVVYAVTQDSSDIRIIDVQNDISGNKLTVELPPLSVAQVVISDSLTDKTVDEIPDIEVKEVTFSFDELEKKADGSVLVPIEDAEHLKKVVINSTASCTSGASWYGGGGGLCFSNLVDKDGNTLWGQKSFMYGTGTSDTTINFDGFFTNSDMEEVEATIGDKYIEFQDWWASSENDDTGADVKVTYNSITLYYEYENSGSDVSTMLGDVNLDGKVNISDAVLIMQSISNPHEYKVTEQGVINGDVIDKGDKLTIQDALGIQLVEAKLIKLSDLPATSAELNKFIK
ncbi:MAG: glycoside hydrolase [Ruminococcus sp.]|nr:glycoside hydrolase [Ruminococcus sp.]